MNEDPTAALAFSLSACTALFSVFKACYSDLQRDSHVHFLHALFLQSIEQLARRGHDVNQRVGGPREGE